MTTPAPAVNNSNVPGATTNRFGGVYPNNTYPLVGGKLDKEQEKRKQARDESARTRRVATTAARAAHPPFAVRGPDAPKILVGVHPTPPTYDNATDVLTIPTKANVKYYDVTNPASVVLLAAGNTTRTGPTTVEARPDAGYRIVDGAVKQWSYTI